MDKEEKTPPEPTEETRLAQDLAIHNWKQSGGPRRDQERNALHLQQKYPQPDNY